MDIIAKTRDDYNKIAKLFSATRNRVWPEFKEFSSYLKDGQRILDWGCGNGRLLMMLEGKKIEYFGVDISKELLKHARKINSGAIKSGQAHFFCTANKEKNFQSGFFDMIFAIASFFHLPDKTSRTKLLEKFYKELKFGGRLYVSVWNLSSDWAKAKQKKGWKKIGDSDFLIPWKNSSGEILAMRYYHHFTKEELADYLSEAGFKIERLYYSSVGKRNLMAIATKKSS